MIGGRGKPGDVAVVRTGWAKHWDNPAAYIGDTRGIPGITPEAAAWLADRAVTEFLFVGAPLNVVGATGAPIRPLALIER